MKIINNFMKKLLPLLALPVIFSACTTTNSNTGEDNSAQSGVEKALPYISPAVTLACTVVLEQALSSEDRVEKAKMINNVATVIESLTRGATPTPDQLKTALSDYLPQEKTHWAIYVNTVKDIYAAQFKQVKGDTKLAIDVLNAIAKGCKDATASYVTQ
jgi:hypothetical protein